LFLQYNETLNTTRYLYSFGIQLDQALTKSTDKTMYALVILWVYISRALGTLFIHCELWNLLRSWSTFTSCRSIQVTSADLTITITFAAICIIAYYD
jgi:hypothetical protein